MRAWWKHGGRGGPPTQGIMEGFSEGVTAVPLKALWDSARLVHVGAPGTP